MELVNNIFDASSLLVDDLSSRESSAHKDIIRKYIEERLTSKENKISHDFKPGLDWINVNKALTFTKELKGKVVVLDFFTYCCINCMHIIPQLKALERNFTVEDGLVVIGVHSPKFSNEHSTPNVKAAVKRYEISHPVVNDHDEHLWNALGICCWPTLVIIGPGGELMLYLMGESHEQLLYLFVKEVLCILKARSAVSSRPIPEIGIHNEYRESQLLYFPGKVCATSTTSGCLIAVADTGHHRVLVMNASGDIQHVIGGNKSGFDDGSIEMARFHSPQGVVFTDQSTLYVADTENHAVRKIDLKSAVVETVLGDGTQGNDIVGGGVGVQQRISSPWDIAALSPGVLLIAMAGSHQIWAYFIQDTVFWKNKQYVAGSCAAIAGSGREENRNNTYPQSAGFAQPSGLTVAAGRQTVYVVDSESSTVRAISVSDGRVSAVVGGLADPQNLFAFGDKDGCGLEAKLQHPLGVAWSDHKQSLYVCDSYNHKVKVVNPSSRFCSTLTGNALTLNEPGGLYAFGNLLYVADTNNHCIKMINLDDYSVQEMSIRYKKNELTENKTIEPIKEVEVMINIGGGQLELSICIEMSPGIKPLPESPALWTLILPEGWTGTKAEAREGVEQSWSLTAPGSSQPEQNCQLRAQCRLLYCHNSLCSVRVLHFLVTVVYSDTAPTVVSCPVEYLFSL